MQVTETLNEGLKRAYEITIKASQLEEKVSAKLTEAQPTFEMKGFRKGKVPMAMMKKQFGDQIMGEVMQESIDDAMRSHFESSGDRPAAQPGVRVANEDWKAGDDVTIAVEYERLPDMPEVDFKAVKLERLVTEVADAEVDEALDNLAKSANNFEDRKKGSKAEDGDQLVINFLGKVDGEAFDGGQADDYPLVLGSGSFIPGFEAQLVGTKVDDELEVKVTFPEEYGAENLAGKDAVFECKVISIKAAKPATIDDELAKQFGADDLAALKTQVSDRLQAEYNGAARQVIKRHLMDALADVVSVDLPPSMVEAEANQIAHQLWHEENPEVEGHDHDGVEATDEHKSLAERRVRLGLFLSELGSKAEITVSDAELQQAMMQQAQQYPGQEKQFFEFMQKNEQAMQQVRAPLFEDKVVDYILELADVSEKTVSKDELQKTLEELSEE
ncbi:MAG: trigger factor [Alphaproteobacteria bacterium]|nr:trigger factor [Alphaproteobacteria bacterium]